MCVYIYKLWDSLCLFCHAVACLSDLLFSPGLIEGGEVYLIKINVVISECNLSCVEWQVNVGMQIWNLEGTLRPSLVFN